MVTAPPYAAVFQDAAEAILIAEIDTYRYRWVNPAACALLGYTAAEFRSLRLHDVHPPEELPAILAAFGSVVEGQPAAARAVPCRRKDGSLLRVDIRGSRVTLDRVAYNIAFFTDVTENYELARDLWRSERNLAEAQHIAGIGSWEWDAASGAVLRSTELHRIYGVDPGSMPATGDAFLAFVHPDDRARTRAEFEVATASPGKHEFEFRAVRPDGSIRLLRNRMQTVVEAGGHPATLMGTVEDITDRRAADEERSRLMAAVEQASDAVVVTDLAGTIAYVNPAFETISGYRRADAVGQNPRILKSGRQSDAFYRSLWARLARGRDWRGRFINRRADGAEYQVEATISPIRDARGSPTGFLGVERDVTVLTTAQSRLAGEFRERAQVAAALARLQPGPNAAVTAAEICGELASVPGVDVAVLVNFTAAGHAVALGVAAPAGYPLAPGQSLPTSRATYLYERAVLGPWAEAYRPRPIDADYGQAIAALGVRATAYAPIRNGEGLLGLVVAATRDEQYARHLIDHLPAVGEFAATASALLARDLEGEHRQSRLQTSIAELIRNRAFHPVYQPIVELAEGGIVGYEALTRFDDGIPPDRRFAEAWSVDLGVKLELATLDAALANARALPAGRWLHLNVSPRLLASPGQVRTVFQQADRPVVVEITEHDPVTDYAALREALRTLGGSVRTAVDDAGAGIANFAHIVELKPDFVKLDIALVRGVNSDLGRQALVIALRHFARATGCRLVAEGIESAAEARTLANMGVDFGQGYYYGRPAIVADLGDAGARPGTAGASTRA